MLMSLTITISSCLFPDNGTTCSLGSSRIPAVSSAYISATRRGVSRKPSRSGSSPMPSRMRRTPRASRSRSTSAGFSRPSMSVTFALILECGNMSPLSLMYQKPLVSKGSFLGLALPDSRAFDTRATLLSISSARGVLHFTQRHAAIPRRSPALLKLGHRVHRAIISMRNFNINWPKLRLDPDRFTGQRPARDFITAGADRSRLGKDHLQKFLAFLRTTQDRKEQSRTVLLHLRLG